jgi:hypothetical protein
MQYASCMLGGDTGMSLKNSKHTRLDDCNAIIITNATKCNVTAAVRDKLGKKHIEKKIWNSKKNV